MVVDKTALWTVIPFLAVGTYLVRFSFLGLVGGRSLPAWLIRALKFTAAAVLPALVAPGVVWPIATGGQPDPARAAAAVVTLVVGITSRSTLGAIAAGAATLATLLALG